MDPRHGNGSEFKVMGKNVRLRKKRWMSYDAAKLTTHQECPAKSRSEYYVWHRKVKPVGLPRYPHRVYTEWTSWNDYLGVENSFMKNERRPYRPFWEAVKFIQALGLKTTAEYKRAYEEGRIPKDIPKAPHSQYDEWVSYPHFFGVDVQAKISAAKHEVGVVALCLPSGMPVGYIQLVHAEQGMDQLKSKLQSQRLQVYKVYRWDKDCAEQVRQVMMQTASPQSDGFWLTSNVNNVLFELGNVLEWVTDKQ